jgi:hypothetical protein
MSMTAGIATQQVHAFVILAGYRTQVVGALILSSDFEGVATKAAMSFGSLLK